MKKKSSRSNKKTGVDRTRVARGPRGRPIKEPLGDADALLDAALILHLQHGLAARAAARLIPAGKPSRIGRALRDRRVEGSIQVLVRGRSLHDLYRSSEIACEFPRLASLLQVARVVVVPAPRHPLARLDVMATVVARELERALSIAQRIDARTVLAVQAGKLPLAAAVRLPPQRRAIDIYPLLLCRTPSGKVSRADNAAVVTAVAERSGAFSTRLGGFDHEHPGARAWWFGLSTTGRPEASQVADLYSSFSSGEGAAFWRRMNDPDVVLGVLDSLVGGSYVMDHVYHEHWSELDPYLVGRHPPRACLVRGELAGHLLAVDGSDLVGPMDSQVGGSCIDASLFRQVGVPGRTLLVGAEPLAMLHSTFSRRDGPAKVRIVVAYEDWYDEYGGDRAAKCLAELHRAIAKYTDVLITTLRVAGFLEAALEQLPTPSVPP